jgi:PAS domain S-box-containing protein
MNQDITIYSLLFLCNTMISFFVALLSWQHRSVKSAKELVKLMTAAGIWSFFIFLETSFTTVEEKIFWAKMAYIGAVTTPVFYLFFVIAFIGLEKYLTLKKQLFYFIIPIVTLILAFTNEKHMLIWSGFSGITGNSNMMEFYHGPAFWIFYMGYNYLIFLIATILLFKHLLKRSATIVLKVVITFVGGLFPWLASIFYLTGINILPGLDLVPGSIILSGVLFSFAILNIKFLDLAPMARETLVENLTDGIIVLDIKNRIQDINSVAIDLLEVEDASLIGLKVTALETQFKKIVNVITDKLDYETIECTKGEDKKYFSIIKRSIKNYPGSRLIVLRDATEQKLVQEELSKSERRYRELTEFLPEMICEVNLDGVLLYANQFALTKFGYTNEEVLSGAINIFNLFVQDEIPRVKINIENIIYHKSTRANEYNVKKKNGKVFPVIVHSSPIYRDKTIIGLRGVMIDITDRKNQEIQIERNLRQQEILSQISIYYNSTIDFEEKTKRALQIIGEFSQVSRVYIFQNSPDDKYTSNTYEWCNEGILPQIDELQNIPYDLIPSWKQFLIDDGIVFSEKISELPQDLRNILEPQKILSIIVLPLFMDGKFFGFIGFDECSSYRKWTKSEIELLRTISNLIANAFLRNKIYNELINSLTEISGIISSIPDSIIRIESNGRIVSCDSQIQQGLFLNFKAGEDEFIDTILSKDLAFSFTTAIKECLAEGKFKFDFTHLFRDEIEFYEARFVKLKTDQVLAIIRNVTESKVQERQLQIAKAKAEEASRAKSEFLANVSHEIRTPLNAILGLSQWLSENTTVKQHQDYLNTILSSGKNLLSLLNDILDLSKIESGKMDIELNSISYKEIITDIKLFFQQKAENKGLSFQINTDPSVPDFIIMDELRFYQILFNLVSNAVKFTLKGFINISAYAIKTANSDSINLVIVIEDTGVGINEDQQQKIFESFTQQSGQSNREFGGTGLGLAIVKGLLNKLNGTISLKSKPGKGSVFTLTFNKVKIDYQEHRVIEEAEDKLTRVLNPCTIMIVDDISYNILVLKKLINSNNVRYIEANDGAEAIAKLNNDKPDLIFMDIRMPGMNGYEVTGYIKNLKELANIPVIAFTASVTRQPNDKIEQIFDGYLQKPVFKKDIDNILYKFLGYTLTSNIENNQLDSVEPTTETQPEIIHNLPQILAEIDNTHIKHWEKIKDNLIIYEIEAFKNQLTELAFQYSCKWISQYCIELDFGLQSFDIEIIEKKLNEFPELVNKLKSHSVL